MANIIEIIERTETLALQMPALAGAFPDFRAQLDLLRESGSRSVYMLGTIKSGKSTLINALLGRDVMPRGAGVKTFNRVSVRAGKEQQAVIRFRSAAELRDLLTFDYRLLGFEYQLPADLYTATGTAELAELQLRFDKECASDQRLAQVRADPALEGLLPRALARIQRTLAGLERLRADFDDATLDMLRQDGAITYDHKSFAQHRRWTDSPDLAALIRTIEMTLPYPARLPASLELVDCQGSDSLNPLDFADIESVVQHADLVLYVVQSRLGVRQADRKLLGHLANAGSRIIPVLNVEGFSPLNTDDFVALERQVSADIGQCIVNTTPPLPLIALRPLLEATGDKEQLRLMKRLWDKRSDRPLWQRLEGGFDALGERLEALIQTESSRSDAEIQHFVVSQAATVARELLARDQKIVGFEGTQKTREDVTTTLHSLIEGERTQLKAAARSATDAIFDKSGPIERELDEFLEMMGRQNLRRRPAYPG